MYDELLLILLMFCCSEFLGGKFGDVGLANGLRLVLDVRGGGGGGSFL